MRRKKEILRRGDSFFFFLFFVPFFQEFLGLIGKKQGKGVGLIGG